MSFVVLKELEEKAINFLEPERYKLTADQVLNDALRAADAHKIIRSRIQTILRPGVSLRSILDLVENTTRELLKGEKNNGIGFPCGISMNDCAAHFSLNPGNEDIFLKDSDVLKIDFGVHSNGRIMDSAFTVCFDPKYEQLLLATQEATKRGLKVVGVDVAVNEIGREIEEVFNSFEITLNNKVMPIKAIWNLNGHAIEQYKIHGSISIPPYDNGDHTRIKDGFFAIETFASTGKGEIFDKGESSHFTVKNGNNNVKIYNEKNKNVLDIIHKEIGTLPFSPKHVDFYLPDSLTSIKLLSARGLLNPYPPLHDIPSSFVAQFEHTVYIKDGNKTILTKGDDY